MDDGIRELQASIRSHRKVLPVGAGSKEGLSGFTSAETERLTMRRISGIVTYDPSEFLITTGSGTRVAELVDILSEHGQYLPFDPLFVEQGATIGGTIASGISGPEKLLYGSLRDFVMEVELLDGLGERVRGGGKVVKNAAGFDLPKLVVGSYGRLGVLTEITLKVLPRAAFKTCLQLECHDLRRALKVSQDLLSKSLPITGLDLSADGILQVTLATPEESASQIASLVANLAGTSDWQTRSPGRVNWLENPAPDSRLIRIATAPAKIVDLLDSLRRLDPAARFYVCSGGSLVWLETRLISEQLDRLLQQLDCSAVVIKGDTQGLTILGDRKWIAFAERIRQAMDPEDRFLGFSQLAQTSH